MPNSAVDYVVVTTGMPKTEVEDLWDKAKTLAKKEGRTDYAYIMGIFKKSLGENNLKKLGWNINEAITLSNWLNTLIG